MDSKELCMRMLRAESEEEVRAVVDGNNDLSDSRNWSAIDDRDSNWNIITNQASTGAKALTELCTNMVDAMLMKHARLKGISLTGPAAPRSVIEGVRDLVELKGSRSGILSEVDDSSYLRDFAEKNLVIGVTGGTSNDICFTFADNGEGQDAAAFESTFLSLSKGNKSDIPFVQGKYNMGSSGVLGYCGEHWYKLIISRRYDGNSPWAWTIVRRRPSEGKPVAEYFRPPSGIPTFDKSLLNPICLKTGEIDEKVALTTGTVVKLYNYHLRPESRSFRGIRESLNENLISTILPFRLMDYRYPSDTKRGGRRALGVDERPLNGMEFALLHKDGRLFEEGEEDPDEREYRAGEIVDIGGVDHPKLGYVAIHAIKLEKEIPGWLKPNRNISRVFHAVNGQVQYKQTRGYLTQCRLPGLKDRVVIIVDSSDLSEYAHNEVWKGDRETIRETPIGELYREEVTKLITNSPELKSMQEDIAREESDSLSEKGQIDLFETLLKVDASIRQLMPGGDIVNMPWHRRPVREIVPYEGEYSPTYLRLRGETLRQTGAEIALDGQRIIAFDTDAVNEYFIRPENKGRVFVTGGIAERFAYRRSLRNGRLTLTFEAIPGKIQPGDEFVFHVGLIDPAIVEPATDELRLLVVDRRDTKPPGPRPRPDHEDDGDDRDSLATTGRGLPHSVWLTRDGRDVGGEHTEIWPENIDFNEQDGGIVIDLSDSERTYKINYDNSNFQSFLGQERDTTNQKVLTAQYRIGMLVLMMGLENAYSRIERPELKEDLSDLFDDIRRLAAQGAATVVMSIAKTLPSIVTPNTVRDIDD